jgi:hypothetical protein
VSGFKKSEQAGMLYQLIADSSSLEGWESGMLEGAKACELPGVLASQNQFYDLEL